MSKLSTPTKIIIGLVAVGVVAFLAFGVFGVHTLFVDKTVDEANPFEVTATSQSATTAPTEPAADDQSSAPTTPAPDVAPTPTTAASGPTELAMGTFVDGDHPTSGVAQTLTDGNQTVLRFEDFKTDNGPDLNVYLRSAANPDEFIDLGDLKGNVGDQNYELPADINPADYNLVDIWCVRFGVSFGSAQLEPSS